MNKVIAACCLYVLFLGYICANKQCSRPFGKYGNCIPIHECTPLERIHGKQEKTDDEVVFLQQSLCEQPSNFEIRVCCPPRSQWPRIYDYRPIPYPETEGIKDFDRNLTLSQLGQSSNYKLDTATKPNGESNQPKAELGQPKAESNQTKAETDKPSTDDTKSDKTDTETDKAETADGNTENDDPATEDGQLESEPTGTSSDR